MIPILIAADRIIARLLLAGYAAWGLGGHPAPMDPSEPDERDESGADDQYGPELLAIRLDMAADRARQRAAEDHECDLKSVADEHELDLDNTEDRAIAEEVLALRLSINERIDHFHTDRLGGLENWLDEWAPGWWEEAPTTVLPTFGAVHALIDDTREHRLVTA